jgi:hydroxymethylpyrimidine pyrophosphatase-like HAD family hydrolase
VSRERHHGPLQQRTILALDLDGTLATGGEVASDTWEALRQAEDAGVALVLVTGRLTDTIEPIEAYDGLFAAIVAEGGAVVHLPNRDATVFGASGLTVTVVNAVPQLRERADVVLSEPNGAGVRTLIADLLASRLPGISHGGYTNAADPDSLRTRTQSNERRSR